MSTLKNATLQSGPYTGWPFTAACAMASGATPRECKDALIAIAEQEIADIQARIEGIKALPDQIVYGDAAQQGNTEA